MSAQEMRTRPLSRTEAKRSLSKAKGSIESARLLLGNAQYDTAGLAAIHGAILASDAVLGYTAGLRNAAKDHKAVVTLLKKNVRGFTKTQERQISGLLNMKNEVAYSSRLFTHDETRILVDQATRYLEWVVSTIGQIDGSIAG